MGKAKMFGGAAVVFGLVMGLLAYFLVPGSFMTFLLTVFLPVLLITIGLIAIIVGVLLLIYG
jgi:hypothetical protein